MTNSILHPTSWLYALALLLLACQSITIASAASVTAGSGSGNLRGVQVEKESANSGNEGPSDEEDSRRRQLYGRQYSQGFESLTQSYSSVPLQHQGQTETANVTSLHSLQGQPVYFEKQSDEPFNPYLRVVGGGPSAEQRNFCMHLNWDVYSNQYVFAGCGGTLIGNCHVLTAAHCSAASRAGMPDGVFCNAYNPFQGNYGRPYHFSTVTNIIMHPAHSMVTNQNDISILQLDTCVPSLAQFPVMQVATASFLARLPASQSLIVSGYGRTSQHDPTQVSSLQSVALPYIPTATCNNYYPGYVMADMICAGQASGGLDACQGDSGGPLFYQGLGGDTNQTVVGIVSWGGGCAQPNQPGVYTNVAYFYDWIKNIVCNDARTDQSIALCRPAVTYSLTSASASISFNTCATLHQACNARSCCSGYVCTARASGYAPTCTVPASSRSSGSGALGRATGWND